MTAISGLVMQQNHYEIKGEFAEREVAQRQLLIAGDRG